MDGVEGKLCFRDPGAALTRQNTVQVPFANISSASAYEVMRLCMIQDSALSKYSAMHNIFQELVLNCRYN